jgi:hypothetical protein
MDSIAFSSGFARTLIIGNVPENLLDAGCGVIERLPVPKRSLDPEDRLPVADLISLAEKAGREDGAILILTDRDLAIRECESIFGFADYRKGVAVVSIFRLGGPVDSGRLRARLRNEIAHELGHLQGYRHCHHHACVMSPVRSQSDIDSRPDRPCGQCPRARRWVTRIIGSMAVCLFFTLFLVGMDLTAPLFGPAFDAPFT